MFPVVLRGRRVGWREIDPGDAEVVFGWPRGCCWDSRSTPLHLHRVEAVTRPDNIASQRVLEKLGMTREGLRRQDIHLHGRWRDSLLFAILESDLVPPPRSR
jgi:hypothetical protein